MNQPVSTPHAAPVGATTDGPLWRCPACRADLEVTWEAAGGHCAGCGAAVGTPDGILDLVLDPERAGERGFYDDFYTSEHSERGAVKEIADLASAWIDPDAPQELRTTWARLGDLRGKRVLLLGNGESDAELYMLTQDPALLILSDLAVEPVRAIRDSYGLERTEEPIVFAAIDALDLPLADASVDVVYGFAFVHHLPDIDRFLAEVARVLRPGGRAVFMDNGYSPLWQQAKTTVLRPMMAYSHRRNPRSPEDVVDTMRGGFKVSDLRPRIEAAGGRPWFVRESFLYYFWHRTSRSLFPEALRLVPGHRRIARTLARLDRWLSRFRLYRANLIRMIWGFDKP